MGGKYNFDQTIRRAGTACYKYDYRKEMFGTEDLIPMWVADMDFATPGFVMDAIRERSEHEILGYTFRTSSFNEVIQSWIEERYQWKVEKEWIVYTPGVVPALNLAVMRFSSEGEEVIIQPPVYSPFFSAVTGHDRTLIQNPLRRSGQSYIFDLENLEQQITEKTRILILCNPHNPVGRSWKKEELEKLASVCLKNNLLILTDEIHADLVLPPHRHTAFAKISPETAKHSISFFAPSKTFNIAGLSTSFAIIPDPLVRKGYEDMINRFHLGMGNIFGLVALEAAYRNGIDWLDEMLNYVVRNIQFTKEYLESFIPEIRLIEPEATYLVWLDCRGLGLNDAALRDFFIGKAQLGLSEGKGFGPGGEGFMRMNVACPLPLLRQAMKQLHRAVREYRSSIKNIHGKES